MGRAGNASVMSWSSISSRRKALLTACSRAASGYDQHRPHRWQDKHEPALVLAKVGLQPSQEDLRGNSIGLRHGAKRRRALGIPGAIGVTRVFTQLLFTLEQICRRSENVVHDVTDAVPTLASFHVLLLPVAHYRSPRKIAGYQVAGCTT